MDGKGANPDMYAGSSMMGGRMWVFSIALLLLFGAAVSACGNRAEGQPPASPPASGDGPASSAAAGEDGAAGTEPAATDEQKKDLAISSRDETGRGAETASGPKDAPAEPANYNVAEPFDSSRPTLMGFSIGDSLEAVRARFGKPLAETSFNDGQYLQVLEYPGFRFGADEGGKIVFIEVLTEQVSPGLNQFRIGQTVEEAQKALGPADSLNDYVMIYHFGSIVLKCDLNPNNKTVIAIRLFEA